LDRKRITEHIITGIRSIDTLHTFGKGQKVGIFSGSGEKMRSAVRTNTAGRLNKY
jgi:flagellum-specific ATP synthase